jgi:hypothetical protein
MVQRCFCESAVGVGGKVLIVMVVVVKVILEEEEAQLQHEESS